MVPRTMVRPHVRPASMAIALLVLAGELSLCSALAAGHLVRAHMAHNRSAAPSAAASRAVSPRRGAAGGRELNPVGMAMTNIVEKAGREARR